MDQDDGSLNLDQIFPEPERPPTPEAKYARYNRERTADNWNSLKIRLVGSHPLWAHYLWNSSIALATFLDDPQNSKLYRNLSVLELGAGGALPSLVAAKNGARHVAITDYPDRDLIENIQFNVDGNLDGAEHSKVSVQGYIWGQSTEKLLDSSSPTKFSLILLSDLIFNHSQHDALLRTCRACLLDDGSEATGLKPCVLVFYTHHRPHLAHRDMEFFQKAQENGWVCTEILTRKFPPMFPEDPGEEEVRSTVHGWMLVHRSEL